MQTMLEIFMVFACIMALFAVIMITFEMVLDLRKRREDGKNAKAQQNAIVKEETVAPAQKEVETKPVCVVEQAKEEQEVAVTKDSEDENAITFSKGATETLEEKYLALPSELKGYYDEIVQYAFDQEGVKRIKNDRYEEYKIRSTKLVKLTIKRGAVVCQFVLLNADFKNYINESNVSVKQAPVTMKIENAESVIAAKNTIDIAVKAHKEQIEYKKELRREKRRQAKKSK